MGFTDTTTNFYRFKFHKEDIYNTHILQYFVVNVLGLCIKINSCVAHMLYS